MVTRYVKIQQALRIDCLIVEPVGNSNAPFLREDYACCLLAKDAGEPRLFSELSQSVEVQAGTHPDPYWPFITPVNREFVANGYVIAVTRNDPDSIRSRTAVIANVGYLMGHHVHALYAVRDESSLSAAFTFSTSLASISFRFWAWSSRDRSTSTSE